MSVLDNYLDTYKDGGIYNNSQYGGVYISKGVRFARFMQKHIPPKSKVLCVGCGNGFEVIEYLNQGHDAYGTELHPIDNVKILEGRIINAVVPNLPFKDKEFELLHCTEVLEHIPPETTDAFLTECVRVSNKQFFSIATEMDSYKTHINIQTPTWWIEKFVKNNVPVMNFQFGPMLSNIYEDTVVDIHYYDGITALCFQQ